MEAKEPEEIDKGNLRFVCALLYDILNDSVQALRNIIVLKDIKSVIGVKELCNIFIGACCAECSGFNFSFNKRFHLPMDQYIYELSSFSF